MTCDVKGLKPTKSYILTCNVIANKKWCIRLQANIKNTNKKLHTFSVSPFSNCKYNLFLNSDVLEKARDIL